MNRLSRRGAGGLIKLKIIDIDRLKIIETLIHYRKEYTGSIILMDSMAKIMRKDIKFAIEYKPVGEPAISVDFGTDKSDELSALVPTIIKKISKLDSDGVLAALHRNS